MSNMQNANSTSQNSTTTNKKCLNFVAASMMSGSGKFIAVILSFVLSRVVHQLLKPLSQPYITSDLIVRL